MAKDYKHRANPRPPPPKRAPGWLWVLTGAVVVAFASFLFALREPGDAQPVQAKATVQPSREPVQRKEEDAKLKAREEAERKAREEKEAAEKARAARPRFQFYAVLPEREFIIPESEVKTRKQQERQGEKLPGGDIYMLQVASFKTAPEAERMKAQLALLGVQGRVETAQIGTATWNRVKVGPFASIAGADKTRALLRENHIDSVVQVQKSAPATPPAPAVQR
ncbi:MAG TPA: SPOR domain-containing protein [Methylococcaceae bacterium]|nr:SPOR domain-containing protein [Methylococcaceae bacterium]